MTLTVSESAFQAQVLAYAKLRHWRTAHFRVAMNAKGQYRTPVAGDGKGFPDLVMLRGTRIVVAELKTDNGRTSAHQELWLDAWRQTAAEVFVWRPAQWPQIESVLK